MAVVLGISAFYHDSAAALVIDGNIVAAAQEERFSRIKHDPSFPMEAIRFCLGFAKLNIEQVDSIVYYDKPLLKFERLLETYLYHAPRGFSSFLRAMPIWLKEKLYLKSLLRRECGKFLSEGLNKSNIPPLHFTEHHQSHAASAYYPSPFIDATIVCLDGVGEWATTSIWSGQHGSLTPLEEIHFPHSLGLLYSAFTFYCGFKVNAGEYKLMGLAPYGKAIYVEKILEYLIDLKDDGSFALNMTYFDFSVGKLMTSKAFHELFGRDPHSFDQKPDQMCMDLAASIQQVIQLAVERIVKHAVELTGVRKVCLAGGVALNCVANGYLREKTYVEDLWVQPAAGDAGGALGAALMYHYANSGQIPNPQDDMKHSQLGPEYLDEDIVKACEDAKVEFQTVDDAQLFEWVSQWLVDSKVVGWFQGRMEFGPRALGNRSILGDPRNPTMQKVMNLKIKQRESFRPFAPAVIREDAGKWFTPEHDSPYMLSIAKVINNDLPAITHVDQTARLQTVNEDSNPRFYKLLQHFQQLTQVPVLINTSFNVRGEPPVCTPQDAIRGFLATDMDKLVMGNVILCKTKQTAEAIKQAKTITFDKD